MWSRKLQGVVGSVAPGICDLGFHRAWGVGVFLVKLWLGAHFGYRIVSAQLSFCLKLRD